MPAFPVQRIPDARCILRVLSGFWVFRVSLVFHCQSRRQHHVSRGDQPLFVAWFRVIGIFFIRLLMFVAMAVGAIPVSGRYKTRVPALSRVVPRTSDLHPPSLMLPPQTSLFLAIDLHCRLQNMESATRTPSTADDEVVYYVNMDFSGWVEQRVKRRVYIELKLELTRSRKRDVTKARDDWVCLYCGGSFLSKLRLTDHRVVGCPCGPVDSRGSKWELPVYPI